MRPVTQLTIALSVLTLLLAACGGGEAIPTPTPTPTATPTPLPTPAASPTDTPTPPVPASAYYFLFAQTGETQDIIWQVDPADPSQREQLATIEHQAGWSILPSLSPDGEAIAYTVLPSYALDRFTQAEAYVLDLASGETHLVAENVDLTFRPLWSPDGKLLYLRRIQRFDVMILQADISALDEPTPTPEPGSPPPERVRAVLRDSVHRILTFIPVGFAPDGESLYFAQVRGGTQEGTDLGSYSPATFQAVATATAVAQARAQATATALARITPRPTPTPTPGPTPTPTPLPPATFVLRLSDQTARDFQLSPDGKALLFTAQSLQDGQFVSKAFIADLTRKKVTPLPFQELLPGDHLRPLWYPDGSMISVGGLPSEGHPGTITLVPLGEGKPFILTPPEQGFDLPLSWEPDGNYLAAISSEGSSLANPGSSRLVMLAITGQRLTVLEGGNVETVGWARK